MIVIAGAGPTGLGAAWRLEERGHHDWLLVEGGDTPGGLARSIVDEKGFTWDLGGHVVFSHYPWFDALLDQVLAGQWLERIRSAWIWMAQRFIPYPLQANLHHLPAADLQRCLDGLLAARATTPAAPTNLREWIVARFGRPLGELFLLPYNFKVWAYDPAELGTQWMDERVAEIDLPQLLSDVAEKRDRLGWGPNASYRYPQRGGTGAIWTALAARLPRERLRFNCRVAQVHARARRLQLESGEELAYDQLLSTMPLDRLLASLADAPELRAEASAFKHSSAHIIGIGVEGTPPESLREKSWIYFPEKDCPFYRVTVLSNHSPYNVPRPGEQWSLLAEVSESPAKPVGAADIVGDTIGGLQATGLLRAEARIVSRFHQRLEYGYPTPFHGRDPLLARVQAGLVALGIRSRGRFGAWRYEVSNQDHSVMQGVAAVDEILDGS